MPDLLASLPFTVQPSALLWAHPADVTPAKLQAIQCPNCGSDDTKALVLTFDGRQHRIVAERTLNVLRCPACGCRFYDDQRPPDYADPEMNDHGCVPFYVQQGAGIGLITRPLAQAAAAPGSSYMEVGCGYGFGLDFALNSRGWHGVGIDPAPLAAVGREALGVAIELRYLRDDDEARGTIDVVMASETIEHVPSPIAFVRTLRAMLRPGGMVVLTTPNGDDIVPATSPGAIVSLLSPTLHLVIQNRESLAGLLRRAGFAHVDVQVDGHSLVSFASDAPLALEHDPATLRRLYRAHLAHQAEAFDGASDVFLGYAGRSLQESVNDGDMAAAARAWALLVPACQDRFGFDLGQIEALPPALAHCDLEVMARLVPLNLGGLLYARGVQRLNEGVPRPELETQFTLAAQAAAALRRALNELSMEDGQTEDIGWAASAESLLCAAAGGAPDIAARLAALPPAPAGGAARRRAILGRAVGSLVNAGHYGLAREAAHAAGFGIPAGDAPLDDGERDLVFSLAVLDVQTGPDGHALGDPAAARRGFMRVRASVAPGSDLWRAALRGEMLALDLAPAVEGVESLAFAALAAQPDPEVARWAFPKLVNAGRYDAARRVAQSAALGIPAGDAPLDDDERNLVFSLAVLEVQTGPDGHALGDPAAARRGFARVRASAPPESNLWRAALRGEMMALDHAPAIDDVEALTSAVLAARPDPEVARWAFPKLVNAGRYDAARRVAQSAALGIPAGDAPLDDDERNLVFSLAVLEVQTGPDGHALGDPAAARRGFVRVRASAAPGSDLWHAALRGEMMALDHAPAIDDVEALASAVLATHPDPELARWAFTKLVNAGRYDGARRVAQPGALTEPAAGQPLAEQDRDVVFCLAVLGLKEPQLPDEEFAAARRRFARVREAVAPGLPLWWAAFHGELQALEASGDGPGMAALTASVVRNHPDVKLGYPEMMRLVGAGQHDAAREVVRRSNLEAGFAQPGSALPLDAHERDCLFFLAVLDAQIGPDGRAAGEPAVGRSRFARVRAATPPGSDLWWAALRGELQSLDLLDAQDEAAVLTAEIAAAHPGLPLPDDIAARIAPDTEARRA